VNRKDKRRGRKKILPQVTIDSTLRVDALIPNKERMDKGLSLGRHERIIHNERVIFIIIFL
jgi:hypothetical protein